MKKIIFISLLLLTISNVTLASSQFIERFYAFSNRDTNAIAEVNYYLEKGGSVKNFQTLQRGEDGTFTTMVIQIPAEIFYNNPYNKK